MILTTAMLKEKLRRYSDPAGKIMRMTANGELFTLTRGLYETDRTVSGYCLASAIYGPSYISFDFALSKYGLIPEAVYTVTSATYDKKKAKSYENVFGNFTYRDIPKAAYPFGIILQEEKGYTYQIASPEKALCDKLYTISPVHSEREFIYLLFEDLRIDENEFGALDKRDLAELCGKYRCANLNILKKMLEELKL